MPALSLKSIIPQTTREFRLEYNTLINRILDEITINTNGYVSRDGTVPRIMHSVVLRVVGDAIQAVFTGSDGRNAFQDKQALSNYAILLNKHIVRGTDRVVTRYRNVLQDTLPGDLYDYLTNARRGDVVVETLQDITREGVNPLYVSNYSYIDPNGLSLNDRVWRVGVDTRERADRILSRELRKGTTLLLALQILRRGLSVLASNTRNTVNGTQGSYSALRLGRTEIAYAINQAGQVSQQFTPFSNRVDIVRSGRGDPKCQQCGRIASIDISGVRVRDPYVLGKAPHIPVHPHCMCTYQPDTTYVDDTLLRDIILNNPYPHINPANRREFVRFLLGAGLLIYLLNEDEDDTYDLRIYPDSL